MSQALIIVDYENEWVDRNSEYFVGNISDKIVSLNKLIKFCRGKKIPIFFTTHIEKDSEKEFKEGTKNVEIISDINFDKNKDILIKKSKISPFYKTELEQKLQKLKVKELIITGILTNLCVRSLASDAYDREYSVKIITDTCAAFDEETHNFTIRDLQSTRDEMKFLTAREFINSG